MKEYKLGIILIITFIIWFFCYLFVPSCDPPEDIDNKLTTWKFFKLTSVPIIIIISMYLFKKFFIPLLT